MDYPTPSYVNRTLHGGINQRLNGRLLSDIEAEELRNVDISVPGTRRKRLDPSNVDDLLEPTIPATPIGLDDSTSGGGGAGGICKVTVDWDAVIGASSYTLTLYAGGSCAGSSLQVVSVAATQTSYLFTGLTGGTTYSWKVQAIGDGENYANSNASACDSFTTDSITLDDDLPDAVVGTAYSADVAATGGTAAYTYAVTTGTLPDGLSLNASNGAITGTPTTADTINFTLTATDANGCTGSRAYTVVVNDPVPTSCVVGGFTGSTCAVDGFNMSLLQIGDDCIGSIINNYGNWDGIFLHWSQCSWRVPSLKIMGPKTTHPFSWTSGETYLSRLVLNPANYWSIVFESYHYQNPSVQLAEYRKLVGLNPGGAYALHSVTCSVSFPVTITITFTP